VDLKREFPELVRAHGGMVFSIALRLTGGVADAEDAAQDAFVAAFRSLQGFDEQRWRALQPRPWLASIVVNVCRNRARAAGRRPRGAPFAEGAPVPEAPGSVDGVVAARETATELATALAKLPAHQRVAVVLHVGGGLSYPEVASAVGRPEGTVKSDVSRGLASLRSSLDPQELLA
jgi:RNA polymerase sigma-70 factor (ECF subfamily)